LRGTSVLVCAAAMPEICVAADVQIKVNLVSPLPHVAEEMFPGVVNGNDDAEKGEKSQHKKNFASGNLRRTRIAGAARRHPFIQLDSAPKNQNQRPPVPNHFADTDSPVVVKEQQQPYEEQEKSGKERATATR